MTDRCALEATFKDHGYEDFKWIDPKSIIVSQWVRMKCMFGCDTYGRCAACPPNTPSVAECREFFREYSEAAILHFVKRVDRPEDRHDWTRDVNLHLLDLERDVFLAGHPKAFLLFMDNCGLCTTCVAERTDCLDLASSRPAPEAMAVDVFSTVKQLGYPINVLPDYTREMNRYAILLIE